MKTRTTRAWDGAEVERLTLLHLGGATLQQCAEATTGRSRSAVWNVLQRHGVRKGTAKARAWDSAEVERLTLMYLGGATLQQCADATGRTRSAVWNILLRRGVRKGTTCRVDAGQLAQVEVAYGAGATLAQAAALAGCSIYSAWMHLAGRELLRHAGRLPTRHRQRSCSRSWRRCWPGRRRGKQRASSGCACTRCSARCAGCSSATRCQRRLPATQLAPAAARWPCQRSRPCPAPLQTHAAGETVPGATSRMPTVP
jgi:hypothetical protein